MLRSAALNTVVSAVLKAAGFAYTLLIVGLAARVISVEQTGQLLLVFGYLAPLGLVQAGIGSLVLRAAMHNHVTRGSIADTYEIGICFRVTAVIASCIAIAALIFAPFTNLGFLVPTIVIMLVGFVCSVADQTWYATERAWVVNVCLALSFVMMSGLIVILRATGQYNLTGIAIITYCAPSLASILSFGARMRDPMFRRLLFAGGKAGTGAALRAGAPLFLVSVASSILVALPTLSTFWHAFPSLTTAEAPLFRLATIGANLAVALLVPFLPWLVHTVRNPRSDIRRTMGQVWIAMVGGGITMGSYLLFYTLPWIVRTWVGIDIVGAGFALPWAFVITTWVAAAVCGQFALMVCNAFAVATVVAICDVVILLLLVIGACGVPVQVSLALLAGLAIHVILALVLIHRTLAKVEASPVGSSELSLRHTDDVSS